MGTRMRRGLLRAAWQPTEEWDDGWARVWQPYAGEPQEALLQRVRVPHPQEQAQIAALSVYDQQMIIGRWHEQTSAEIEKLMEFAEAPCALTIYDYDIEQQNGQAGLVARLLYESAVPLPSLIHSLSREERLRALLTGIDALILGERLGILHQAIDDRSLFQLPIGHWRLGRYSLSAARRPKGQAPVLAACAFEAPESVNQRLFDARSDQYSLALVAYALFNDGLLPFISLNASAADREQGIRYRLQGNLPPPPRIAEPALSAAILRALDPNPERRFACATDWRAEIRAAVGLSVQPTGNTTIIPIPGYQPGNPFQNTTMIPFPQQAVPAAPAQIEQPPFSQNPTGAFPLVTAPVPVQQPFQGANPSINAPFPQAGQVVSPPVQPANDGFTGVVPMQGANRGKGPKTPPNVITGLTLSGDNASQATAPLPTSPQMAAQPFAAQSAPTLPAQRMQQPQTFNQNTQPVAVQDVVLEWNANVNLNTGNPGVPPSPAGTPGLTKNKAPALDLSALKEKLSDKALLRKILIIAGLAVVLIVAIVLLVHFLSKPDDSGTGVEDPTTNGPLVQVENTGTTEEDTASQVIRNFNIDTEKYGWLSSTQDGTSVVLTEKPVYKLEQNSRYAFLTMEREDMPRRYNLYRIDKSSSSSPRLFIEDVDKWELVNDAIYFTLRDSNDGLYMAPTDGSPPALLVSDVSDWMLSGDTFFMVAGEGFMRLKAGENSAQTLSSHFVSAFMPYQEGAVYVTEPDSPQAGKMYYVGLDAQPVPLTEKGISPNFVISEGKAECITWQQSGDAYSGQLLSVALDGTGASKREVSGLLPDYMLLSPTGVVWFLQEKDGKNVLMVLTEDKIETIEGVEPTDIDLLGETLWCELRDGTLATLNSPKGRIQNIGQGKLDGRRLIQDGQVVGMMIEKEGKLTAVGIE